MKVLIRTSARSTATVLGEEADLLVRYPEVNREVSRRSSPLGTIREMRGTGRYNRRYVELRAGRVVDERRSTFVNDRGDRPYGSHLGHIAVSDAGQHVRLCREEDLEAVAAIDAEIDRLRGLIGEQRKLRVEAVRRAWRRGKKVTTRQLMERADAALGDRA